jgi:high-affinity nickel-transport protein
MASLVENAPADSRSLEADRKWSLQPLLRHAERSHQKMPGIRKIPLRAISIILFIALLNAIVWIAAAIVLVSLTILFPSSNGSPGTSC